MGTLAEKLAALDEEAVLAEVKEQAESGANPVQLFEQCREGMVLVGDKYESGEYYISDLMLAAHIFSDAPAQRVLLFHRRVADLAPKEAAGADA